MADGLLDHNQFCKSDSNFRGTVRQVYGFASLFLFHFELKFMYVTRKDMALSSISINSALADKEFVLSLHHKLHVSTCINKPNDVHKHNQSIIHSINQSFLHKQQ